MFVGEELDVEIIDEEKKKRGSRGEEAGTNHRTPRIFKLFRNRK